MEEYSILLNDDNKAKLFELLSDKNNYFILESFLSLLISKEIIINDIKVLNDSEIINPKYYNYLNIKAQADNENYTFILLLNDELAFTFNVHSISMESMYLLGRNMLANSEYANKIFINLEKSSDDTNSKYILNVGIGMREVGVSDKQYKTIEEIYAPYPKEEVSKIPKFYDIKLGNFKDIITDEIDEWIYLFKNLSIKPDFKSKNIEKAYKVLASK